MKIPHKVTLELTKTTVLFSIVFLVLGYFVGNTLPIQPIPSGPGTQIVQETADAQAGDAAAQQQAASGSFDVQDDPTIGDPNAPIMVIEFSDFECPFCQRFYADSVKQMEEEYVKTGKVLFVYKDFPLEQIHPAAVPAAMYANCANEQGKWKEMHDAIFTSQYLLQSGQAGLDQMAQSVGLDAAKLQACLTDSQRLVAEIQDDLQQGVAAGVTGTPSTFIGNKEKGFVNIVGAQPYSIVKQAIEQQLQ